MHAKTLIMEYIKKHKSIRKYKEEDISDSLLREILSVAERTQTMGNLQLYSVVVTRSAEMKQRLAPAHFCQPMVTSAPVVLTICADFHRTTRWAEEINAQPGYDNFLSFINAATDALLYTQNICNIAEEKGLGDCFLGTTVYQPLTIIDVLQLPQLVFPIATITLGWPDEEPALSDRLPLDAVLHSETYADYSAADIDKFYTEKEQLAENIHFCEINNKQTLAQVFTDIRYTKKDNEAMSATMLQALKQQGFLS